MDQVRIRNFCIIAHIDHGKSTLADRLLEETFTVSMRDMREQLLDQMDLERERGITIKLKAVCMNYKASDGLDYQLNLIDTPGHVDFSYEVSRSLAACEGAILVVDATQGIQAQTLANVHIAQENKLTIIPVINKIDLPSAEPEKVSKEIQNVIGFFADDIIMASAKTGTGVKDILEAIVKRIPPPGGNPKEPLRALIFDSKYDSYKGVVAYVRVVDGAVAKDAKLRLMVNQKEVEPVELGVFKPGMTPVERLATGEVGYVATGLKTVAECHVGDTVTSAEEGATTPLPGYRPAQPMVFAGIYPIDGEDYASLHESLDKLSLNDASLVYEPESSAALGFGFRCGFLGLLHMDIVKERLEREYDLELVATAPSVAYQVTTTKGDELSLANPSLLPSPAEIAELREPWVSVDIIMPAKYIGSVMELLKERRGDYRGMEYFLKEDVQSSETGGALRVMLKYDVPLSELIIDFYDQLKSRTQGYASMDYNFAAYLPAELVKLEILINSQPVDAFSLIVPRERAYRQGRDLVSKLRKLIPRQNFEVAIQAAIGSKVIVRETVKPYRKDVIAKCYGGDITRKRKLLSKQAEGKKRMKMVGRVEIPPEAFVEVLRI
ncbi:MAG: translation elongation factor 4 [Dehalococcoidia bacterium]|jgi:GTP-binding protein LepA